LVNGRLGFPAEQKLALLKQVFLSTEAVGVPRVVTYDGVFDAFATECLQLVPVPEE
jgi:hypothetical protein